MLKLRIWFNKHLQAGMGGYLLILGIALLLLLCLVCLVTLFNSELSWNTFYALGFNPVNSNPWLYIVLGICGTLVFGGVMVTVFTSGVERSVERLRNGQIRYRHLKNHIIVMGWNNLTVELLSQLCRKYPDATVILLVENNAADVNTALDASLQPRCKKKVIVYASGTNDPLSLLSSLCLEHARALYLTASDTSDTDEIARLMQLSRTVSQSVSHFLPVYIQINDVYTYNTLQRLNTADIHLYNFFENWARNLWGYGGMKDYDQLDFEPLEKTGKHVHLVIVGFGNMGLALFLEALRICHYPTSVASEITVIDPHASRHEQRLYSQFPSLRSIGDIKLRFVEDIVESEAVRQQLSQWADDPMQLLTVAVCFDNPDYVFRTAVNLPEQVFLQPGPTANTHVRVLVRQSVPQLPGNISLTERFPNVKFFGTLSTGFDLNMLSDDLAIVINGLYCDNLMGKDNIDQVGLRFAAWQKNWLDPVQTPEASKYASRYQADRFRSLKTLLRRYPGGLEPELLEQLSESEHNRWVAERILAGWRQAKEGEHRDNALLIHNNMISYASLSESEKEKDRNVIRFAQQLAKQDD